MKKVSMNKAVLIRFGIILALQLVQLVSFVNNINEVLETKDHTVTYNEQKSQLLEAVSAHHVWAKGLLEYVTLGTTFTGALDDSSCGLGQLLASDLIRGDSARVQLIADVQASHSAIHAAGVEIMALPQSNTTKTMEIYNNTVVPNVTTLVARLAAEISAVDALIAAEDAQLVYDINVAKYTALGCMVVVVITCVTTIAYLKEKVARPLEIISAEADKLAEGNLSLDFTNSSDVKEIQELAGALTESVKKLKWMIGQIGADIGELSEKNFTVYPTMTFPGEFKAIETSTAKLIDGICVTLTQIGAASSDVQSASKQFSMNAQILADGSTEQAASVDELATTLGNMANTLNASTENAVNASSLGEHAQELVEQNASEMNELVKAMELITESATGVGNIIKTINDVAMQTNILALNAAVEAARAGESGKGFAVVADEVRNLAQKSADAVKESGKLIQSTIEAVRVGSKLVETTNDSFGEMKEDVMKLIDLVNNVASALEVENTNLRQVTIGMQEISTVVQTNTATSEENASTSEELNAQVVSLNSLVGEFRLQQSEDR